MRSPAAPAWLAATELIGGEMPGAQITQLAAHCLDDIDAIAFLFTDRGNPELVDLQSSWLNG